MLGNGGRCRQMHARVALSCVGCDVPLGPSALPQLELREPTYGLGCHFKGSGGRGRGEGGNIMRPLLLSKLGAPRRMFVPSIDPSVSLNLAEYKARSLHKASFT